MGPGRGGGAERVSYNRRRAVSGAANRSTGRGRSGTGGRGAGGAGTATRTAAASGRAPAARGPGAPGAGAPAVCVRRKAGGGGGPRCCKCPGAGIGLSGESGRVAGAGWRAAGPLTVINPRSKVALIFLKWKMELLEKETVFYASLCY